MVSPSPLLILAGLGPRILNEREFFAPFPVKEIKLHLAKTKPHRNSTNFRIDLLEFWRSNRRIDRPPRRTLSDPFAR